MTARKLTLVYLKIQLYYANNKIRHQSAEKVSKEIAMHLLEHLITLYVRVVILSRITVSCIKLNQKRKTLDHCELK